jgi:TolA-binding protein
VEINSVVSCAASLRHDKAQAIFAQAYNKLVKKDYHAADLLFESGMHLEHSADSEFYFAESQRGQGNLDDALRHYKNARSLGLNPELDAQASAIIIRLSDDQK